MQQTSGLLSRISISQYSLLTMEGELHLEGNLALTDGFYSNIDLSDIKVSQNNQKQIFSSGTFKLNKLASNISDTDDCACSAPSDDCNEPDDCDCECLPS